ncbi:TadE/TadG family type IV pilus assembly protein [Noviherbaspirillum soli]|uniref:TadE/TadG family type IV pilus assembly protein n=1 Tax=Noviherbaspirillum soli TaxID=1064518 RepID=UPI00188AE70C|nr:TadE/TadG family type IV pilus assembly protein [Noviherbaspirillum soli]
MRRAALAPAVRQTPCSRGGTLVEFALVAPVVLLLFFAILELAILFWVSLTMQHAVREGARLAVTGAGGAMRETLVMQRVAEQSMGLHVLVHPVLHVNGMAAPVDGTNPPAGIFGAGGGMLLLRLDCSWPVATPLLRPMLGDAFRFSVAASMRNEAFE